MSSWRPALCSTFAAVVLMAGVLQWVGAPDAASAPVASATVGTEPFDVAVDSATESAYVTNFGSNTVSVLDTTVCDGTHQTNCAPIGTANVVSEPRDVAVDDTTNTVYVVNSGAVEGSGAGVLSVFNGATCDAGNVSSCASIAEPVFGDSPFGVAVNASTNTVYVTNESSDSVSVLDGATCDASNQSNCTPIATVTVGSEPKGVAVDATTDTVYVGNYGSNSVSVIDGAVCDATNQSNCTPVGTSDVMQGPRGVAVDAKTDSVYVADSESNTNGSDTGSIGGAAGVFTGLVSVIDGATCGAASQSNCNAVGSAAVGYTPEDVAVDEGTNTIYATNYGGIAGADVSVIDGATCDATTQSGCEASWSVAAGGTDTGIAVDPSTASQPDSVYVTNYGSDTVSTFGQPAPPTGTTAEASGPGAATVTWAASTAGQLPVDSVGLSGVAGEFTYENSAQARVQRVHRARRGGHAEFEWFAGARHAGDRQRIDARDELHVHRGGEQRRGAEPRLACRPSPDRQQRVHRPVLAHQRLRGGVALAAALGKRRNRSVHVRRREGEPAARIVALREWPPLRGADGGGYHLLHDRGHGFLRTPAPHVRSLCDERVACSRIRTALSQDQPARLGGCGHGLRRGDELGPRVRRAHQGVGREQRDLELERFELVCQEADHLTTRTVGSIARLRHDDEDGGPVRWHHGNVKGDERHLDVERHDLDGGVAGDEPARAGRRCHGLRRHHEDGRPVRRHQWHDGSE